MAILLDGKATSAKLQEEIRTRVQAHFTPENAPRLCVILVGENPASASYVRTKCKMAEKLGFRHEVYHFDADVEQSVVEAQIDACNADPQCDAVFVQLPLPKHLDAVALPNRVRPDKDADGLTRAAMGALLLGESNSFQPCTPRGVIRLLQAYDIALEGLDAVVIGRSNIVGKPISLMLQRHNATVTMCHTRTRDLAQHVASSSPLDPPSSSKAIRLNPEPSSSTADSPKHPMASSTAMSISKPQHNAPPTSPPSPVASAP